MVVATPLITCPFLYHVNTGLDPPFITLAVNVIFVPAQILLGEGDATILLDTVVGANTFIVAGFVYTIEPEPLQEVILA